MRIRSPIHFALSLLGFSVCLIACSRTSPELRERAEEFVKTYYLMADPNGALKISQGPASEKIQAEIDLLKSVPPSNSSERPAMTYQILSCETTQADLAQCDYRLDITMDRVRTRKGSLTLRNLGNTWRVTQFIEAPYQDP